MNRRSFITHFALTASVAAPMLAAPGRRRFKTGFLGASYSHARDKIRIVQDHPQFELVGGCDASPEVRARYPNVRWLSREELLQACDVVFVESEVADHGRDAITALQAGKHLHVEKPPSTHYSEMVEMVQLAQDKKRLLQTGYMWRYHPGFVSIFEAVKAGWLGEIYQVQGHMSNLLEPLDREHWAQFKGGALFEQGSHLIDPMIRLLGKPIGVTSVLQSSQQDALADNNVVTFQFPKAVGIITNSTQQPNASSHRSFEVRGTNGTILLKPIEPPQLEIDLARAAGPFRIGRQSIPLPAYTRYRADIDEFAAALSGEGKLRVSLEEELLVQEWILRACTMI